MGSQDRTQRDGRRWPLDLTLSHAVLAAGALGAGVLALWLVNPPEWSEAFIRRYEEGIRYHKLLGITAGAALVALAARHRARPARRGSPAERRLAAGVQAALAGLTLTAIGSGYVSTALYGQPLDLPGLPALASPLPRNEDWGAILAGLHEISAYALLALAAGHGAMGVLRMTVLRPAGEKRA